MALSQVFWFIAGALAIVALLFLAYPWLSGRPRAQLPSVFPRWAPWVGGGAVLAVVAIYLKLGSAQLTSQDSVSAGASGMGAQAAVAGPVAGAAASAMASGASKQAAGSMDSAVAGLEKRLAGGGGSDGDWELLAKSYEFLGRPDAAALARQKRLPAGAGTGAAAAAGVPVPAVPLSAAATKLLATANDERAKRNFAAARAAYFKLAARNEMTADAWADYADVVATMNGNSLDGTPATYIANALRLDPRHAKALWLQASWQHETKQYAKAASTWQLLAGVLGADSGDAKLVAANLAEDQRLAGGAPAGGAPAGGATSGVAAGTGVRVVGEVVLADTLQGKVPAGLTLFILAKSVNSPGAPVAILRTMTTTSWPVKFQLDDSQAMLPQRKLSTAGPVTIEARTSKTGQAAPAPGDFLGTTAQLDPAAGKPVRIVIKTVIG